MPGPACVPTTGPSVVATSISRVRPDVADQLLQRGHALGRVRVRDADAEPRLVARRRPERLGELLDRLPVPAHPLEREDLAVLEREDRLDVQELAGPAGGAADPAAPGEELERVEREDQARLALEARRRTSSISSSVVPRSSRRWTARASIAIAADAVPCRSRAPPPSSSAARSALSYVPESLAET